MQVIPNIDEYRHLIGKTFEDSEGYLAKIYDVYLSENSYVMVLVLIFSVDDGYYTRDTRYDSFTNEFTEIPYEKFAENFKKFANSMSKFMDIILK